MKFFGKTPKEKTQKPKEESRFPDIRLLGKNGSIIYEGPLGELRFQEKLVIAKSIFFFNDEEPCYIHRGAVAVRLFGEINLGLEKKDRITTAELYETCPGYLDEYPGVEYIEVKREDVP